MVAAMPRFNSTGLRTCPSSRSRLKFCMLRAPTCRISEYFESSGICAIHHFADDQQAVSIGRGAHQLQDPLHPCPESCKANCAV